VPVTRLGTVHGEGDDLTVVGQFSVGLNELREAWTGTMPRLFGSTIATNVVQD
jgi:phosphoribosylformylglycinamidine synthase subunit PurL